MAYGGLSLVYRPLRNVDFDVQNYLKADRTFKLDDYLIYGPLAMDVGFSLSGVRSAHSIKEKAALYLLSSALNAMIVYPVKSMADRQRPDGSNYHSFPSGHTSNAFVGAEFFWQEYKHRSFWLASSGYLMATATAYLRIRNNKHWLSDVMGGAGIGMLSTKVIYRFYPWISQLVSPGKANITILPISSTTGYGINVCINLN
jgi:membrane-associated phospholipid phosphatase